MNKCVERLYNGIVKENPTLVLTLGMCPTLAVTTSAINGAGMGLALCSKIVEMHGGKLTIKSKLNEGTRVEFLIKGENE